MSIRSERLRRSSSPLVHGNNIHIDADSLIRHNRELLRLAAQVRARSLLYLQNIIAWWQHNAIVSRLVCSQLRDLSFPVLTQDISGYSAYVSGATVGSGMSSGSTALITTIFKCRSMKPYGAALMDAALASNREMQPAAMKLGIVDIRRKTLWQLVFTIPPDPRCIYAKRWWD